MVCVVVVYGYVDVGYGQGGFVCVDFEVYVEQVFVVLVQFGEEVVDVGVGQYVFVVFEVGVDGGQYFGLGVGGVGCEQKVGDQEVYG